MRGGGQYACLWSGHQRQERCGKKLHLVLVGMGWRLLESGPRACVHDSSVAVMAAYADDLLLVSCGAESNTIRDRAASEVEFKDPPAPRSQYFGALYTLSEFDRSSPSVVRTLHVNMVGHTQTAVDRFMEDFGEKLKLVATPYKGELYCAETDGQAGRLASSCISHVPAISFSQAFVGQKTRWQRCGCAAPRRVGSWCMTRRSCGSSHTLPCTLPSTCEAEAVASSGGIRCGGIHVQSMKSDF